MQYNQYYLLIWLIPISMINLHEWYGGINKWYVYQKYHVDIVMTIKVQQINSDTQTVVFTLQI